LTTSELEPHRLSSTSPNPVKRVSARPLVPLLLFVSIMSFVLGVDMLIKYWSFENVAGSAVQLQAGARNVPQQIPYHDAKQVIPSILSLRLTLNTGAIFGIGKGAQWFFVGVSVIATAFICFLFWRSAVKAYWVHICYAMILGGALGNMYDRVVYYAVRDMFWLFPGVHLPFGLNWPGGNTDLYPWLFNVADAALIVGVLTLMLLVQWDDRQQRKSAKTVD